MQSLTFYRKPSSSKPLGYEEKTPLSVATHAWGCDLACQPIKCAALMMLAASPSLARSNSTV